VLSCVRVPTFEGVECQFGHKEREKGTIFRETGWPPFILTRPDLVEN
jgi:hypothetical protein